MTAPSLSLDSVVEMQPLHIGEEVDGAVEVGRPDTGVFVSLPVEGATVVRWLVERRPLAEISRCFLERYGVELDVPDFVRDLSGCGFVRRIDDRELAETTQGDRPAPSGWRVLGNLPQSSVGWLLSKPAYGCYAAIWAAAAVLLITRSELRPSAGRAYQNIGVLGNLALLTVLGWLLVLLHELAHLAATRARGCSGSLDISYRLHLLVAQTDISSVRTLPHSQRYAPYLAGMTCDVTMLLGCCLLQLAGVPSGVPRALTYLLAMSLLFQLALFVRTDLYYVMTNALRLGNLMGDTRRWMANLVSRALGAAPRHDLSDIPARELRFVRWYAMVVVLGVAVVVSQFLLLGLPLLVKFIENSAAGLRAGPLTAGFWNGVALLLIVVTHFLLLGIAILRERRRVTARSATAAAGMALAEG
ncbi:MAG: hypothetical protein ACJ74U_12020 [Jatrophihabitantaceae bacterium]